MTNNFTGKLLIAPPKISDGFWHKSVIFVTEDHENGSVGLLLNKRSSFTIVDFTEQIGPRYNIPGYVHIGGPVNIKALTMLHSSDWACSNTMEIDNHFSISSSDDLLPKLGDGDVPRYFRLFLGMCGWAPKQLMEEYEGIPPRERSHSWLEASANYDLVFNHDQKDQWIQSIDRSSADFAQSIFA
jgi:putative transcriptional regulator